MEEPILEKFPGLRSKLFALYQQHDPESIIKGEKGLNEFLEKIETEINGQQIGEGYTKDLVMSIAEYIVNPEGSQIIIKESKDVTEPQQQVDMFMPADAETLTYIYNNEPIASKKFPTLEDYLAAVRQKVLEIKPINASKLGIKTIGYQLLGLNNKSEDILEFIEETSLPDTIEQEHPFVEINSETDLTQIEKDEEGIDLEGHLLPNSRLYNYISKLGENISGYKGVGKFLLRAYEEIKKDSIFCAYEGKGEDKKPKLDEQGKPYFNLNLISPILGELIKNIKISIDMGLEKPQSLSDLIKQQDIEQTIIEIINEKGYNISNKEAISKVKKRLEKIGKNLHTTSISIPVIKRVTLEELAPEGQRPSDRKKLKRIKKELEEIDNESKEKSKTLKEKYNIKPPIKDRFRNFIRKSGNVAPYILAGFIGAATVYILDSLNILSPSQPKTKIVQTKVKEVDYNKIKKERQQAIDSHYLAIQERFVKKEIQTERDKNQDKKLSELGFKIVDTPGIDDLKLEEKVKSIIAKEKTEEPEITDKHIIKVVKDYIEKQEKTQPIETTPKPIIKTQPIITETPVKKTVFRPPKEIKPKKKITIKSLKDRLYIIRK